MCGSRNLIRKSRRRRKRELNSKRINLKSYRNSCNVRKIIALYDFISIAELNRHRKDRTSIRGKESALEIIR